MTRGVLIHQQVYPPVTLSTKMSLMPLSAIRTKFVDIDHCQLFELELVIADRQIRTRYIALILPTRGQRGPMFHHEKECWFGSFHFRNAF